jgi:biopolymer transport protein ExbD
MLKSAKAAGEKKVTQGQNPTFRLVIRGDEQADALAISQAMNAGGEAGISDISFSTVNKQ